MGMSSPVSPKRCCCVSAEAAVGAFECAGGTDGVRDAAPTLRKPGNVSTL